MHAPSRSHGCAQDVTTVYTLGRVLGRGQFGTTRLAVHKASGKEYACKSIGKRKLLCAPSPKGCCTSGVTAHT